MTDTHSVEEVDITIGGHRYRPGTAGHMLGQEILRLTATIGRVQVVLDDADEQRLLCASDPDCECSYKDCYECGKWHNCTHTPLNAVRDALHKTPEKSNP